MKVLLYTYIETTPKLSPMNMNCQVVSERGHVKTLRTFRNGFHPQKYTYYEGICQYI